MDIDMTSVVASAATMVELVARRMHRYARAHPDTEGDLKAISSNLISLYGQFQQLTLITSELQLSGRIPGFGRRIRSQPIARLPALYECYRTINKLHTNTGGEIDLDDPDKWPFSPAETKQLIQQLHEHKETLAVALAAGDLDSVLKALSRGSQEPSDVTNNIKEPTEPTLLIPDRTVMSPTRRHLLQTFSNLNPDSYYFQYMKLRHPMTGIWLIESDAFQNWLATPNSKLWLHGGPGVGKTVLAASAIEETLVQMSNTEGLVYFFCDYKDQESQQTAKILASFIVQLARQDEESYQLVQDFYNVNIDSINRTAWVLPDSNELRNLFFKICEFFPSVSVIVDGLDECEDSQSVIATLTSLNEQPSVKTLFFSRTKPEIQNVLVDYKNLQIAANGPDLKVFIAAELSNRIEDHRLHLKDISLKEKIVDTLIMEPNATFRWVECQVDYLCGLPHDDARRGALSSLPSTLEGTYEQILDGINAKGVQSQTLAARMLRWIFNRNKINLEVLALCHAISIDEGDVKVNRESIPSINDVQKLCGSLVRASRWPGVGIESAHFTVKDFLEKIDPIKKPQYATYKIDENENIRYIGRTCLQYLTFEDFSESFNYNFLEIIECSYPFYEKAAMWGQLFRGNIDLWDSSHLELSKKLFSSSSSPNFSNWAYNCFVQRLHMAPSIVGAETFDFFAKYALSCKPLHWAALEGLPDLCEWLLTEGADPNHASVLGNPIHCALVGRSLFAYITPNERKYDYLTNDEPEDHPQYARAASVLLKSGADPNLDLITQKFGKVVTQHVRTNMLCVRHNAAFLPTLLQSGLQLDGRSLEVLKRKVERAKDKNSALVIAAQKVVELVDADSLDDRGQEAFIELAKECSADAATVPGGVLTGPITLLSQKQENKDAALISAVKYGQASKLLEILQTKSGDDLDMIRDSRGDPLLHIAAAYNHSDVLKTLLEHGANPNKPVRQDNGSTALHVAAQRNALECCQLLLAHGADPDVGSKSLASPLLHAAYSGNVPLLRTLLDAGADVSKKDGEGYTAWHTAAVSASINVLRELASKDPDLTSLKTSKCKNGRSPLHMVAMHGNKECMEFLLSLDVDDKCIDNEKMGLLHTAIRYNNVDTLQVLLERGHNLSNIFDDPRPLSKILSWPKPLWDALMVLIKNEEFLKSRRPELAHLLVQDIAQDRERNDWKSLLESILGTADIRELKDEKGATLLHSLFRSHCSKTLAASATLELLLGRGLELSATDQSGSTPIKVLFESLADELEKPDENPSIAKYNIADLISIVINHCSDMALFDIRPRGYRPFSLILASRVPHLIRTFLPHVEDVDQRDEKARYQFSYIEQCCYHDSGVDIFETILKKSKTINDLNPFSGDSILHMACVLGQIPYIISLLEAGADINVPRGDGRTPLMHAAKNGKAEVMRLLIDQGANVAAVRPAGWNAAFDACLFKNMTAVKILDQAGIDWTTRGPFSVDSREEPDEVELDKNMTLIHLAAAQGRTELLEFLTAKKDCPEINLRSILGRTALHYAVWFGHTQTIKWLLKAGGDTSIPEKNKSRYPMHRAVIEDLPNILQLLLDNKADPWVADSDGRTPLRLAQHLGRRACMQILKSHLENPSGQKPDSQLIKSFDGEKATLGIFARAIEDGDIKACKELIPSVDLSKGLEECDGCSPLLFALSHAQVVVASLLLEHGASVTGKMCARHNQGWSALTYCISLRAKELFHSILKIDPAQATDDDPEMPSLHYASGRGLEDGIKALLEHGADVNLQDAALQTPLHVAVKHDKVEVVRLLLEAGALVNARDAHLRTCAMIAAAAGELEQFLLLEKYGIDFAARDIDDWSVIGYAASARNVAVVAYLHSKGHRLSCHLFDYRCPFKKKRGGIIDPIWTFLLNSDVDWSCFTDTGDQLCLAMLLRDGLTTVWLKRLLMRLPDETRRAYLEKKSKSGTSGLYYAAATDLVDELDVLLDAGANLHNDGGPDGTPLMTAAKNGRLKPIKRLIKRGALVCYNKNGETFNALTLGSPYKKVIQWLLVGRFQDHPPLLCWHKA